MRFSRILSFVLLPLLCGCVNFVSMKGIAARDITLSDTDKITIGMHEKQVISILGSPQTFGIDDQGREYLHYEAGKLSRVETSAVVPFVGIVATSSEIIGFVVNYYIADGLVQGKSQYFYRAAADKDKEKMSKTQDASK